MSNPPRRRKSDLIAANEAESAKSIVNTGSATDGTGSQILASLPTAPFRASDHPEVDISRSPLPQPLEAEPCLTASTNPLGLSVVSDHLDYIGFGPAQISGGPNPESLYLGTSDFNFDFDAFSVPLDELTYLDQDLSSQYRITMPLTHPFMRQTQDYQSNFAFRDSDDPSVLSHISWNGLPSDRSIQKLIFPELQPGDEDVLAVEDFCHVEKISDKSYQAIRRFYAETPPVQATTFPHVRNLNAFIQLYFEYFDDQFPFLHRSAFDVYEPPWILVLAVAAVGSQYSQVTNAIMYTVALQELLRRAIAIHVSKVTSHEVSAKKSSCRSHLSESKYPLCKVYSFVTYL